GYIWNLHRLNRKAALKFSSVVKADYKRAKEGGYLDSAKLDEVGKHNSKMFAIRYPKIYILFRPLHDLRNKIRPSVSKVVKAISPRYRQRLKTIDALDRLRVAQEELASKIENIEKRNNKK
ncbi:hypothetical protein II906_02950, partial [bacterium]|nr:hypothetical protein [bacterium]